MAQLNVKISRALSTLMITRYVAYGCRTNRGMVQPVAEVGGGWRGWVCVLRDGRRLSIRAAP